MSLSLSLILILTLALALPLTLALTQVQGMPYMPLIPPNPEVDATSLDALAAAFGSEWGGTKGALPPSLARKLAAMVLPRMTRIALPAGKRVPNDGDGK